MVCVAFNKDWSMYVHALVCEGKHAHAMHACRSQKVNLRCPFSGTATLVSETRCLIVLVFAN